MDIYRTGDSPSVNPETSQKKVGIGEAARQTGLSVSAIRKYEAAGLLLLERSGSGYRQLTADDIERIRSIQRLIKEEGLNLEGIRRLWALFPCWKVKKCPTEIRDTCQAFQGDNLPCWLAVERSSAASNAANGCRTCKVYLDTAKKTEELKRLIIDLFIDSDSASPDKHNEHTNPERKGTM